MNIDQLPKLQTLESEGHDVGFVGTLPDMRVIVVTRAPDEEAPFRSNHVFERDPSRHWREIPIVDRGGSGINAAEGSHYHRIGTAKGETILHLREEGGGWQTQGPKEDLGSMFNGQRFTNSWFKDDVSGL